MAMELFLTIDALDGNALIDPLILPSLHTFWQAPFMCEMHNRCHWNHFYHYQHWEYSRMLFLNFSLLQVECNPTST